MFRKSPGFKKFSERIADASRDLFSTPTRGAFLRSPSGSERIVAQQSPAVGEGSRPPSSTGPDTGTPGPPSGGGGAVQIAPATTEVGKDDARNEMVDSLQEGFFEEEFDPLMSILHGLPLEFAQDDLEGKADDLTHVLDAVNEQLSARVLEHKDDFMEGMGQVTDMQADLQQTHVVCKNSRRKLRLAAQEVAQNMQIASNTRRKRLLGEVLGHLQRLQEVATSRSGLLEALDADDYSTAIEGCLRVEAALAHMGGLSCVADMKVSLDRLLAECVQRVDETLQGACSNFTPERYETVVRAHLMTGDHKGLSDKTQACFQQAVVTATQSVLRAFALRGDGERRDDGVALVGPDHAGHLAIAHKSKLSYKDLAAQLPVDQFRPCLHKTLEVLFDLMASHHRMTEWHAENAALQAAAAPAVASLEDFLAGGGAAVEGQVGSTGEIAPLAAAAAAAASGAGAASAVGAASGAGAASGVGAASGAGAASVVGAASGAGAASGVGAASRAGAASVVGAASGADVASGAAGGGVEGSLLAKFDAVGGGTSGAPGQEAPPEGGGGGGDGARDRAGPAGDALERAQLCEVVGSTLQTGREVLFHMAQMRVTYLLGCQAAAEAEHFLQVLEWTNRFARAGEAFTRTTAEALKKNIGRRTDSFFAAFHRQNLEALRTMIEKELWQRLPPEVAPPPLRAAFRPQGGEGEQVTSGDFDDWVQRGNPFRESGQGAGAGAGAGETPAAMGGRTGGGGAVVDEDDDEEDAALLGDYIDEDRATPTPPRGPAAVASALARGVNGDVGAAGTLADGDGSAAAITAVSVSVLKWMAQYAHLMRALGSGAGSVFHGLCQLFECCLLATFQTFGERRALQLAHGASEDGRGGGGGDTLTPRLRSTLSRIARAAGDAGFSRDAAPPSPAQALKEKIGGRGGGVAGGAGAPQSSSSSAAAAGALMSPGMPSTATGGGVLSYGRGASVLSSGNLFALKERCVAVESLAGIGEELRRSRAAMQAVLPLELGGAVDQFFSRTVGAVEDLREHIYMTAARLLMPIPWLAEEVGKGRWDIKPEEMTNHYSPWVDRLAKEFQTFRARLAGADLAPEEVRRLLQAAATSAGALYLEGLSRVKKCSVMGRAAMAQDLGVLVDKLRGILGAPPNMLLVDNYIKAFYEQPEGFVRWALTHPEYTRAQVESLLGCMGRCNNWGRSQIKGMLSEIEAGQM